MSLKQKIEDDLKTAMLARDEFVVETLRTVKGVILNEEVARGEREAGLDDASIESLLFKEVKKRHEAAELFDQGGNSISAEKERKEAELLQGYLPKQLSDEELDKIVSDVITEAGEVSIKDMGRVIGQVKQQTGNQADGAAIASMVKNKLS